jgi:hypothetical protein
MRISLILMIFSWMISSCGSNDTSVASSPVGKPGSVTTIQWLDSAKNYGDINEGQKLALSFRFKNNGSKPLIIESVKPACGCTVADYPKEPIAPGAEGEITGEFDSNGREGLQRKHLTVRANTPEATQDIMFEVNVVGRPQKNQATPTN